MKHPEAAREARILVDAYDGSAKRMVETRLDQKLDQGDVNEALKLDQVRREIAKVYEAEGE